MIQTGILNPRLLSLVARVRHTNCLVIADRGFPFWPDIETLDLSLVDNIPTVLQVVAALRSNVLIARAWMAQEFVQANDQATLARFQIALKNVPLDFEPHAKFKKRVPTAIGLVRTADTTPYSNLIVESG
jgi:D-ribose pyranase